MTTSAQSLELESVKTRFKDIWMADHYVRFSRYIKGAARDFYERLQSYGRSPPRPIRCHVS
jgi:hypothetical protein